MGEIIMQEKAKLKRFLQAAPEFPGFFRAKPGGDKNLHLLDVSLSHGGTKILDNVDITFAYGYNYALIGENGCGKTTFLKYLSSREIPIPDNISIFHVEQEI